MSAVPEHHAGQPLEPQKPLPAITPPPHLHHESTKLTTVPANADEVRSVPPSTGTRVCAVLVSGPTWAGAGSTVVTFPVTIYGAIAFGVTTVWTAVNEYRNAGRNPSVTPDSKSDGTFIRSGVTGFIAETLESPGLAPLVQSGCFVYAATVAAQQNNWPVAAIFYLFAVGEAAGSYVGNKGFVPKYERIPTLFERAAYGVWDKVYDGLKTVLRNPGTSFCIGNLALVAKDLKLGVILARPESIPAVVIGVTLVGIGAVRGLMPLFTGGPSKTKESGTSSISGGIGDLFLGTGALILGNAYVGAATILWGVSNIFYGLRQTSPFFNRVASSIAGLFKGKPKSA